LFRLVRAYLRQIVGNVELSLEGAPCATLNVVHGLVVLEEDCQQDRFIAFLWVYTLDDSLAMGDKP
jgi:hypothetical protein